MDRQALDLRLANAVASIGGMNAPGGITAPDGTVLLSAGGTITQEDAPLSGGGGQGGGGQEGTTVRRQTIW